MISDMIGVNPGMSKTGITNWYNNRKRGLQSIMLGPRSQEDTDSSVDDSSSALDASSCPSLSVESSIAAWYTRNLSFPDSFLPFFLSCCNRQSTALCIDHNSW